jgi:hypothetical protein
MRGRLLEKQHERNTLRFDVSTLIVALDVIYARLTTSVETPELSGFTTSSLPYSNAAGTPLIVAAGSEGVESATAPRRKTTRSADERLFKCQLCAQEWPAKEAMLHSAYHMQQTPELVVSKAPCGFCASGDHRQLTLSETTDACPAWLAYNDGSVAVKKSKTALLSAVVMCRVFGKQTFSIARAKTVSVSNPSTNTLIMCPACPKIPSPTYHWKYNGMRYHWDLKHQAITMPPDLESSLEITAKEREGVKRGGAKPKKRRKRKRATATSSVRYF